MNTVVPSHATSVTVNYGKGVKATVYIWATKINWVWWALGNTGEEATQNAAIDAARDYILYNRVKKSE